MVTLYDTDGFSGHPLVFRNRKLLLNIFGVLKLKVKYFWSLLSMFFCK